MRSISNRRRNELRAAALPVLPSLDGARIGDLTAGPGLTPFPPKARSRGPLLRKRFSTGRAGMIPGAEECRRKAKEAEAMAETARDQAAREILREVAELWRKLAAQVERRGR